MHRTRTRVALAALALAAVAAPASAVGPLAQTGGAAPSVAHGASTHVVGLQGLRFHPSAVTIHRGESVTWVWRGGSTEHNVTGGSFRSRTQTHGSFTVRFNHTGTFAYRCTLHAAEGMVGKVVVR